jgi:hypothetical protein
MTEPALETSAALTAAEPEGALTDAERVAKAELVAAAAEIQPAAPARRKSKRGGRRHGAGRPRGAKTKRSTEAEPEPESEPLPEPSAVEIAGTAALLETIWRMLGTRLNRRPLEREEARELAVVTIPVLNKYGASFLDQWGSELALGITLIGLWDRTALPGTGGESDPAESTATVQPLSPA